MARNVSKPQTEAGQQHDRARDMGPFGPDFREPTQKELQMPGDRPFMVERPLPEDRWPRGYTPGRQQEIVNEMPRVVFSGLPAHHIPPDEYLNALQVAISREDTDIDPSATVEQPTAEKLLVEKLMAEKRFQVRPQFPTRLKRVPRAARSLQGLAVSNITDSLSRSDIDPQDLSGLNRILASGLVSNPNHPSAKSNGAYNPQVKEIALPYPLRSNHSQRILLHELGHHNDPLLRDSPIPPTKAEGEGFAEGFAYKNLNIDPRDSSPIVGSGYLGIRHDQSNLSATERRTAPFKDIRDVEVAPHNRWPDEGPLDEFISGYHRGYLGENWKDSFTPGSSGPFFSEDSPEDQPTTTPPKRSRQDFEVMQLPGLEDDSPGNRVSPAMGGPQFAGQVSQTKINPLKGYVKPSGA